MRARVAIALMLSIAGCGGSGAHVGADMAPLVGKLCTDARADAWTLPIAKTSANGAFTVTLMSSQASPPVIGDTTTWILQVQDATGAMVGDATMTALPYMPDHHHGTTVKATVTPASTPGQYTVTPLYLFMAGYWQITFTIVSGATTDTVVYSVCLSDA